MPRFVFMSNEIGHVDILNIRRIYKMETFVGSGTFQVYVEFRNGDITVINKGMDENDANVKIERLILEAESWRVK